jgi:hypothetical protein
MPDYSKGKIYTIRSHQTDDVYIGSTTQSLKERLRGHKKDYNSWKNGKRNYTSSYEIIKYDDAYIELLEDVNCERKEQLHKREGELIREMDCVNKFIPCRTDKEYRNDNREKIAERGRLYREKNKEKITEDAKLYYQKNKEKEAERGRLYREKNKERIKAHYGKKYICECGGKYIHAHKARHLRSKKHQAYLDLLNNI